MSWSKAAGLRSTSRHSELRPILSEEDWDRVKLVIVGGCRGKDDWKMLKRSGCDHGESVKT